MARTTDPEKQLAAFLAKFTPETEAVAQAILNEMRRRYPTAIELVYDNYNALAIGFAPSEKTSEGIFSIAVYPKWVSLFFLQAAGLPDPDGILKGSGNVARHVVLASPAMLDDPSVQELMREATSRAKVPLPARGEHRIVIKSISETQRPRRPVTKATAKKAARKTSSASRKSAASERR